MGFSKITNNQENNENLFKKEEDVNVNLFNEKVDYLKKREIFSGNFNAVQALAEKELNVDFQKIALSLLSIKEKRTLNGNKEKIILDYYSATPLNIVVDNESNELVYVSFENKEFYFKTSRFLSVETKKKIEITQDEYDILDKYDFNDLKNLFKNKVFILEDQIPFEKNKILSSVLEESVFIDLKRFSLKVWPIKKKNKYNQMLDISSLENIYFWLDLPTYYKKEMNQKEWMEHCKKQIFQTGLRTIEKRIGEKLSFYDFLNWLKEPYVHEAIPVGPFKGTASENVYGAILENIFDESGINPYHDEYGRYQVFEMLNFSYKNYLKTKNPNQNKKQK